MRWFSFDFCPRVIKICHAIHKWFQRAIWKSLNRTFLNRISKRQKKRRINEELSRIPEKVPHNLKNCLWNNKNFLRKWEDKSYKLKRNKCVCLQKLFNFQENFKDNWFKHLINWQGADSVLQMAKTEAKQPWKPKQSICPLNPLRSSKNLWEIPEEVSAEFPR